MFMYIVGGRILSIMHAIRALLVGAVRRLPTLPRRPGVVGQLVPPPSTIEYRNARSVAEYYRRQRERSNYEVTSEEETP